MGNNLMARRFVISDTHFRHGAILKYCDRPFSNEKHMEDCIIKNWNDTVSKHDIVWHLGDVAFGPKENLVELLGKLNGTKILVMGNHDCKSYSCYISAGFTRVYPHPVIIDEFYIMSHVPVWLSPAMPYANIHGHLHQNNMEYGGYFNASVENINYTPILLENIKEIINAKVSDDTRDREDRGDKGS
jgi:calcineurin-like phosphoesterase family protein